MNAESDIAPDDCNLLVAIAHHVVPERWPFLLDIIKTLADFPIRNLDVYVFTNAAEADTLLKLSNLLTPLMGNNKSIKLIPCSGYENPFDLPWQIKPAMKNIFMHPSSKYTHWLYLEDDMRFGYKNFCYWLSFRPKLEIYKLIPSFVRTEYSNARQEICCTDMTRPVDILSVRGPEIDDFQFISPPQPYCAIHLMDRKLAIEYISSKSFDPLKSLGVVRWETRERAAAGLCWEAPPTGYRHRYVIPFDKITNGVPGCAWISHLPNNYADTHKKFAKIPMNCLIS